MKVKQLNFVDGRAQTPVGVYRILRPWHSPPLFCFVAPDGRCGDDVDSEVKAQAAAQADFERRVKECFEGQQ